MNKKIIQTSALASTILIRLAVGLIFLSEGIQKFLFPGELGSGRFEKIGIPAPDFFGPFVGTFEIICGSLVLIGFLHKARCNSFDCYHVCCDYNNKADEYSRNWFLGICPRRPYGFRYVVK